MNFQNSKNRMLVRAAASTAVLGTAIGLILLAAGIRVARADGSCHEVSGSISASVVTNPHVSTGLALGTVTGNLAGATMATFTATPESNGNLNLVLHHNFVTDSRDSLTTTDTGTLVPVPGLPGVFRMSVNYTITGGTGRFANATGSLQNHGEADLNTGLLTLTYSGQVCTAQN
jgi:hypothetical protein